MNNTKITTKTKRTPWNKGKSGYLCVDCHRKTDNFGGRNQIKKKI